VVNLGVLSNGILVVRFCHAIPDYQGYHFSKTGGSDIKKAVLRITIWGTIATGLSDLVGSIFGVRV